MTQKSMNPAKTLAAGYVGIIFFCAFLLHLPVSAKNGVPVPFIDALFTSTSSACVTGLAVFDTWFRLSVFGQAVMLLEIQIGGLGFMAVILAVKLASRGKVSLAQRALLAESIGDPQLSGVVRLFRIVLTGTIFFELLGTALLAIRFVPMFGAGTGLWFSLFHAVSAFCNAGFDLLGILQPSSSLTHFSGDPLVLLTIGGLIVIGGIGFIVWDDILTHFKTKSRLNLHTRVVLAGTAILIGGSTVWYLLSERGAAFAGMSAGESLLNAVFMSITPRTAGFNAIDLTKLSESGKLLTMLLMFVGAAPGGTGGGVKITTVIAALVLIRASLLGRDEAKLGRNRLEHSVCNRAMRSILLYSLMTLTGIIILSASGVHLTAACFECLSAIGTVGLTLGITTHLTVISKIAVILLMYAGRIGSFTVFLAITGSRRTQMLKDPVGRIVIG